MSHAQEMVLEHGKIAVLSKTDNFLRVLPDPQWSLADAVHHLRNTAFELSIPDITFTYGDSAIEISVHSDTDPLMLLHAYDLASRWGMPHRVDSETDPKALAEAMNNADGGREIVEVAAAIAAVRDAEAQRRYDELATRLGVVGAPEPHINQEEYEAYMACSIYRPGKLFMQYLEKQLAAGGTLRQAAREGRLLLGLSKVEMANVHVMVADCWERGNEYERAMRAA